MGFFGKNWIEEFHMKQSRFTEHQITIILKNAEGPYQSLTYAVNTDLAGEAPTNGTLNIAVWMPPL